MLQLYISIKFRAFGITFGTVAFNVTLDAINHKGSVSFTNPQPVANPFLNVSERGVTVLAAGGL